MMMMFHTTTELLPPRSSPTTTISSVSSSDFDTESSGSFFHDRSTTLGTLLGVTTTFRTRTPSQRPTISLRSTPNHRNYVKRKKEKISDLVAERLRKRIRRWWLCGGEVGEFLEVERRFGVFGGDALMDVKSGDHGRRRRRLFANGRPPTQSVDVDECTTSSLCRFSVLFAGMCSGCIRYIAR